MSETKLASPRATAHVVAVLKAGLPDEAEAILADPVHKAEGAVRDALGGATNQGGPRITFARRRAASYRLEAFRALEAGDEPEGPRMPEAGPEDVLEAWVRRTGPVAAPKAVTGLEDTAERLAAKAAQMRAAIESTSPEWLACEAQRPYLSQNMDRLAAQFDDAEAAEARAEEARAAGEAIRSKLAEAFGAVLAHGRADLETSIKTAAALAGNLVDADPEVRALRDRKAEIEAELGRLAAVGVKAGFVGGPAADELKAIEADIRARAKAVADRVSGNARDLLDAVEAGAPWAIAQLAKSAAENPRAFAPDVHGRFMDMIVAAVQAGGEAAVSVLCPDG